MACCKINCKGVFGIIFANVGLALLLSGFLTCHWLERPLGNSSDPAAATPANENEDDTTHTGLVLCSPISRSDEGETSDNDSSFNNYFTYVATIASLVAALSLMALGDIFISIYCSFCCCCTCGIITAGGLHIASSLFNFLGCGIYTYGIINWNEYQGGSPSAGDFGWSFYATWVAALITLISGLLETQGVNAEDYAAPSRHQMKQPVNVVYQPRATMNPAYAAYDF